MKKLWGFILVILIGAVFCLGASLPAMAGNCGYVVNGDFGVTDPTSLGFETDYEYLEYDGIDDEYLLWGAALMTIVNDPQKVHLGWPSFTHDGNMLVVNGQETKNTEYDIWSQSFSLRPSTNYVLSFELANVSYVEPAIIYLNIENEEGETSEGPFTIPGVEEDEGKFERFEIMVNSGSTGNFELTFTNVKTEHSGNDFAMDNICMKDVGLMVDIKPGSCPNAFNMKQKGVMPAAIMGSDYLDVDELDMDSVKLCLADDEERCISPVRVELLDAGLPWSDDQDCINCLSYDLVCQDNVCDYDGIDDLALKFNYNNIVDYLLADKYDTDDFVKMIFKASYKNSSNYDLFELQGQDCIIIVNK